MRTILLHVGTHKTGSTSLQKTFHKYSSELKKIGIEYLGGEGAYPYLYSAFMKNPMEFEWNALSSLSKSEIRARDKSVRSDLVAQIKASSCPTVIISNEYLSKLNRDEQFSLKAFLERHGRVIAIYYYRELLSWMTSDSQQLAKVGLQNSPTQFSIAIDRVYGMPLRVYEVFGKKNTRFIRFEDAVKKGICNSFLETFDLPTLASQGYDEVRANESISANAVRAMYLYNSLFPLGSGMREAEVADRLRALDGPSYELAGLTEEQIAEYAYKRTHISEVLGLSLQHQSEIRVSDSLDPMAEELLKMVDRFLRMKDKAS